MVSWMRIACALLGLVVLALFPSGLARAQGGCRDKLPTEPITLNLRDANVQTTLRLLAQQYRANMVVTDEVKGTITLDFFQVPARDVFQVIIESANLQCVEAAGVLRVSTTTRLKQEEDERQRAADARTRLDAETRQKIIEARQKEEEFAELRARGPVKEMTIRLSYADAEEVARTISGILGLPPGGELVPTLQPQMYAPPPPVTIPAQPVGPPTVPGLTPQPSPEALAKGLTVRAYKPTNTIFIRFYENDLNRIAKLIKESLDIPLPLVQIAAQMVITTQSALEQIGIAWGGAAIGQPRYPRDPALIGQGYSQAGVTQGGTSQVPTAPVGGTPVVGTYSQNPNFMPAANTLLPISATTGFPVGGNLINLPITAANPALGLLFGIVGSDFNLNLAIQALETQGKARSLSEPKIVTVENVKAVMSRGFEVPFTSSSQQGTQVQFKDALLELTVTPNVIYEGPITKIRLKVIIQNDEPSFSASAVRATADNPAIFKRKAITEVVMIEGERLVIGGVTKENSEKSLRGVPLLSNIPVLGWLFKKRETSSDAEELVVILTPTVLKRPDGAAKR